MNDPVRRAITLANEAATDPSKWQGALTALAGCFRAEGASLFTPSLDPVHSRLLVSFGDGWAAANREYFNHWVTEDPCLKVVQTSGLLNRAGEVRLGTEFMPDEAYVRTPYFNDYVRHYFAGHKVTLKVCDLADARSPVTHLTFGRLFSHGEAFREEDKRLLWMLWPELQRAVQVYWMTHPGRAIVNDAEQALDAVPYAAWVLREDAQVDYANRVARSRMQRSSWIWCGGDRLRQVGDIDELAVCRALREVAAGAAPVLQTFYVEADRLHRAVLRLVPIADSSVFARGWPRARALLFLDELPGGAGEGPWLDRLAAHHGLTPAQRRVLEHVGAGRTVAEIADALQIGTSTVRSHLYALNDKTGCRRQAELARLALGG